MTGDSDPLPFPLLECNWEGCDFISQLPVPPSLVVSLKVFAQESSHSESELEESLLSSAKEDGGHLLRVCGPLMQARAARWCVAAEAKTASFQVLMVWEPEVGGPSGAWPTAEGGVHEAGPTNKEVWQEAGPTAEEVLPIGGEITMIGEGPPAVTPSHAGDAGEGEEPGVMVGACAMEDAGKGGGGMERWLFCG